jgi:hypothetical protein
VQFVNVGLLSWSFAMRPPSFAELPLKIQFTRIGSLFQSQIPPPDMDSNNIVREKLPILAAVTLTLHKH